MQAELASQLAAKILAGCRLEETWVAVFLHQGIDLAPGQVEAAGGGIFYVLHSDDFSLVVEVNLREREKHLGDFLFMLTFLSDTGCHLVSVIKKKGEDSYLSWGIADNEFIVNLLSFCMQHVGGCGVGVVLAGQVESQVLLTVL